MANNYLDISMITNEGLMVLENELVFSNYVNKQYDDRFGIDGAKIGYTVNVRKPPRFKGTAGPALNVEDINETSIPVTLTTQFHVDVQFTEADRLLALDMFSERIIKPAMKTVANRVDFDGLNLAYRSTANQIGTPGTPPSGALTFLQAGALLDSEGTPRDGKRTAVLDPWTHTAIVDGLKGLFNPQAMIAEQYRNGMIAKNSLGIDNWAQDQNVSVIATASAPGGSQKYTTTGTSTAILSTGWADNGTLQLSGLTATTGTINVGDVITIAGVYAVNPQNRATYGNGRLRQFVVLPFSGTPTNGTFVATTDPVTGLINGGTYTANGSGALTVQIATAIITGGQFQNVSAAPANNAAVTVTTGPATGGSPQNLLFHRDAYVRVVADLPVPGGVDFAGRQSDGDSGLSVRVVRQYTVNNDSLNMVGALAA